MGRDWLMRVRLRATATLPILGWPAKRPAPPPLEPRETPKLVHILEPARVQQKARYRRRVMVLPFSVGATDTSSRARRGTLQTRRGAVETPAFMCVGTR